MQTFSTYLKNRLEDFFIRHRNAQKLIIINSYDKIEAISEALQEAKGLKSDTSLFCFKARIPEALMKVGADTKISEDFLSERDYLEIDKYVFNEISRKWDKDIRKAFSKEFFHRGIELARIAEYNFQIRLIPKIKALIAISRLMQEGSFKAIFSIDTNGELGEFIDFLKKQYGISAEAFSMGKEIFLGKNLRRKASSIVSAFLDLIGPALINKKHTKLIDARLFYQLEYKKRNCTLALFEKGIKVRLKSIIERRGYIAFRISDGDKCRCGSFFKKIDLTLLKNNFIFLGIDYWEFVKFDIRDIISCDFSRIRKNIDIFMDICRKNNLKSVILRNDVKEAEKTVVFAAKNNNITSLVVQHGILAEPNGHNVLFVDKIAVWGDYSVRWYERFGNNKENMILAGNFQFDSIFRDKNKNTKNRDIFLKGIPKERKRNVITLITTGISTFRLSSAVTDDTIENLIREVAEAVESIKDTNLIVKLHPNESIIMFSRLIDKAKKSWVSLLDKADLHNLLRISDVVVTIDSTVGLEAAILGKPLVVVNLSKRKDLVPYVEKNIALGAYDRKDIEAAIRKALFDDREKEKMFVARQSFINEFIYEQNGKSREKILELIEKM